jgi:hypothetical protein
MENLHGVVVVKNGNVVGVVGDDIMDITPKSYTPNDLAKKFTMDAKKVRMLLRKHKIQKKDGGKYSWSQVEYINICRMIEAELSIMAVKSEVAGTK